MTIARVTRPMLPFYGAMVLALVATTAAAPLSTWLPATLGLIDRPAPQSAPIPENAP